MPSRLQERIDRQIERITRNPFRGAWVATATVTLVVTILAGILMQLTDPDSFPSVWSGLWWAVQTTTTVGYGDVVPGSAAGRLIATLVMLGGIGFISVTTAGITTAFVESARRRRAAAGTDDPVALEVRELRRQVEALTAEVRAGRGADGPSGPS